MYSCPNLMNMADDYKCQAYRRNSNNSYWTGAYLIVTSNLTFAEWLASCGIKVYRKKNGPFGLMDDKPAYTEHYKAMKTRYLSAISLRMIQVSALYWTLLLTAEPLRAEGMSGTLPES